MCKLAFIKQAMSENKYYRLSDLGSMVSERHAGGTFLNLDFRFNVCKLYFQSEETGCAHSEYSVC